MRGAKQIALIDNQQYRLDFAQEKLGGLELINFDEKKVVPTLKEMFPVTNGPDVCIEAVGFHYTKSLKDKIMMTLMMEADPSTILNEMIMGGKKRGRLSIVSLCCNMLHFANLRCDVTAAWQPVYAVSSICYVSRQACLLGCAKACMLLQFLCVPHHIMQLKA